MSFNTANARDPSLDNMVRAPLATPAGNGKRKCDSSFRDRAACAMCQHKSFHAGESGSFSGYSFLDIRIKYIDGVDILDIMHFQCLSVS